MSSWDPSLFSVAIADFCFEQPFFHIQQMREIMLGRVTLYVPRPNQEMCEICIPEHKLSIPGQTQS